MFAVLFRGAIEMTTLTKEQVAKLAREAADQADVACDNDPDMDWYTYQNEAFAALCRADLVAEVERLESINAELVNTHNRMVLQSARDEEKRDALRAEVERLKAERTNSFEEEAALVAQSKAFMGSR